MRRRHSLRGAVRLRDDAPQKRRLRNEPARLREGAHRGQLFEREATERAPPDQPWPESEGADSAAAQPSEAMARTGAA